MVLLVPQGRFPVLCKGFYMTASNYDSDYCFIQKSGEKLACHLDEKFQTSTSNFLIKVFT